MSMSDYGIGRTRCYLSLVPDEGEEANDAPAMEGSRTCCGSFTRSCMYYDKGQKRYAMCVGGMALHPGVWAGRRRLHLKCETPGDGLQQARFGGVEESRRIYQSAHSVITADA